MGEIYFKQVGSILKIRILLRRYSRFRGNEGTDNRYKTDY